MFSSEFLAHGLIDETVALAAVALLGYLFGRRSRRALPPAIDVQLNDEFSRAQRLAEDLKRGADQIGAELRAHARSVDEFQARVAAMQTGAVRADWQTLGDRADKLIGPTLQLATVMTLAGAQLRRQQDRLTAFSGSRIDPSTGLHNRRSLEEQLDAFCSIHAAGKRRFSLAMFSLCPADPQAGETAEELLRGVARLLEECIREDDFVARSSHDEFVVLMPQTTLAGALAFGERLIVRAMTELDCPLWGGVVEAASDERPDKVLSRADSALYSSRTVGVPALFQHNGAGVRRHPVDPRAAATEDLIKADFAAAGL